MPIEGNAGNADCSRATPKWGFQTASEEGTVERQKKRPVKIDLAREKGELVITWKGGHESHYSLVELRKNCPCAECETRRGQAAAALGLGELPLIDDAAVTATAEAVEFDYVGRYGIRLTWADGHDLGIYTFASLRAQDEATERGA